MLLAGLGWGLDPRAGWDVDGIAPGSVMRALAAEYRPEWWSTYGPVPYLAYGLAALPLVAILKLAGEIGTPSHAYPWGFAHPVADVNAITLLARAITVLMALAVAGLAAREARAHAPRSAWLVPVLLAGSAVFVYYGRTTNVDLSYLFWTWAAFHLAEQGTRLRHLAAAGAAAALAVCCKEQSAPFAVVACGVAMRRAWRGDVPARWPGWRVATLPVAAALLAYAAVWRLPFGQAAWRAHLHFVFVHAPYPRTYPATPAGALALTGRIGEELPAALGGAVLAGVAVALLARVSWRGLGARALACALYAVGFLFAIGYVYPRFLLPVLLLSVPLAARGLDAPAGRWRPAVLALAVLLALPGGPLLAWTQARDPRLAVERWLAPRLAHGATVEIAGNPRFQARTGDPERDSERPEQLRIAPRAPRGDIVLLSSFDRGEFERDSTVARAWLRPLLEGGRYAPPVRFPAPWSARFAGDLPVAPEVEAYVRRP